MSLLYALFFLSGAAGLVYQVVWARRFHEIFGVTVHAVTTVLAVFLAGLALGAVVLGRLADRRPEPLRLYGWLELGIAATALTGAVVLGPLDRFHVAAASRLGPDSLALVSVRALLASVVILPPTFLMGGTLPAITRVFVGHLRWLGRRLSLLYGLNTLGAVAGTLLSGFVLIRWLGLTPTLRIAAATNLAVGAVSLWMARRLPGAPTERTPDEEPRDGPPGSRGGHGLLVVMGLSGFVTLGLEVFWTRTLVMVIGTTTYAFVTMLASFLAGIALGSLVARPLVDRMRDRRRGFGWIQLGIAFSTLLTLPLTSSGAAQRWLTGLGEEWLSLVFLRFGVSLLIMLVPAALIGMTFPLAARIWTRDMDRLGADLGKVYGANTLGNILGAALSGFLLLPALGLQRGIVVLTGVNLVNAAWGFLSAPAGPSRFPARLRTVPVAVGTLACVSLVLFWQPRALAVWGETEGDRTLYYREGIVSTVKVLAKAESDEQLWMTVDGIKIGQSYGGVDSKQQALAHFPFLLMNEPPRRVLSIGLGTGILVGEVARHEAVDSVDCVEISPSVIEAARFFERFNHRALDHPKIRVIADDGVNFLRRSSRPYDAIISDAKSRTKHAANATFFSSDYYRLCRSHLRPGGMMIQWVPLDLPPSEMRVILRTFRAAFPSVYVLVAAPHSTFLVGVEEPLELELEALRRTLRDPATKGLRRYGLDDPDAFLALVTADGDSLASWLDGEDVINSFEHPVLEFYSPRAHAVAPENRIDANLLGLLSGKAEAAPGYTVVGEPTGARESWQRAAGVLARAVSRLEDEGNDALPEFLARAGEAVRGARGNETLLHTAAAAYRRALAMAPDSAAGQGALGNLLGQLGRFAPATDHLRRAVALRPDDTRTRLMLAMALRRGGHLTEALLELREAIRRDPASAAAMNALAELLATASDPGQREPREALRLALRASELTAKRNPEVLNTLATAYAAAGDYPRAVTTAEAALELASSAGARSLAQEIRRRLELFRKGRTYLAAP